MSPGNRRLHMIRIKIWKHPKVGLKGNLPGGGAEKGGEGGRIWFWWVRKAERPRVLVWGRWAG